MRKSTYNKAIVSKITNPIINGSVIDVLEYFLAIYEYNKDFKLLLLKSNKDTMEYIHEVVRSRYNLNGIENFRNNIEIVTIGDLFIKRIKKALIADYITIKNLDSLSFCDKLFIICSTHNNYKNPFKKLNKTVSFGEMPFDDRDENYKLKILFKRFPLINTDKVNSGILLNSPRNNNIDPIRDFIKHQNKPLIFKRQKHLVNFFKQFDTYIYYHANKCFDAHPRLFLECEFYNKEIFYINNHGIKDGSYYRYYDLVENGLDNRFLEKEDEIVREFI